MRLQTFALLLTGAPLAIAGTLQIDSPNPEPGGRFGWDVAGIVDVNSDGAGDLVVGAINENIDGHSYGTGRAYIFSGSDGSLLYTLNSPNPSHKDSFDIGGGFGNCVDDLPSRNGSLWGDVIVAAYGEPTGLATGMLGHVYVFSGRTGSRVGTLVSPSTNDLGFGWSAAGIPPPAGEVGLVAVGAPMYVGMPFHAGRVYVYDRTGALDFDIPCPDQHVYNLTNENPHFGSIVAGVPDTDGDGYGDIAVGCQPWAMSNNFNELRAVYIFSGFAGGLNQTIICPDPEFDLYFGSSIAGLDDVNGDGRGDLLVVARETGFSCQLPDHPTGRSYVFSGADGSLLYRIDGTTCWERCSSGLADIDRDSRGDFIMGDMIFSGRAGELITDVIDSCVSATDIPDTNDDQRDDMAIGKSSGNYARIHTLDRPPGIEVFHQLPWIPAFSDRHKLTDDSLETNSPPAQVCADGSRATVISFKPHNLDWNVDNYTIAFAEGDKKADVGEFGPVYWAGTRLESWYTHPSRMTDVGYRLDVVRKKTYGTGPLNDYDATLFSLGSAIDTSLLAISPDSQDPSLLLQQCDYYGQKLVWSYKGSQNLDLLRANDFRGADWNWMPCLQKLVFSAQAVRDGPYDIYVLEPLFSEEKLRNLTLNHDGNAFWPRSSPEGDWIAFCGPDSNRVHQLWVMSSYGSTPTNITHNTRNTTIALLDWYDDDYILFREGAGIEGNDIYRVARDGSSTNVFIATPFQGRPYVVDVRRAPYPIMGTNRFVVLASSTPGNYGADADLFLVSSAAGTAVNPVDFFVDDPIPLLDRCPLWGRNDRIYWIHEEVGPADGTVDPVSGHRKELTLQITHKPTSTTYIELPWHVFRAPVLMVHDVWGSIEDFTPLYFAMTGQGWTNSLLTMLDYRTRSPLHLEDNNMVLHGGVLSALTTLRMLDFSAGEFDVVAHGLGGLLARLYMQHPYYPHTINRLLTCDTPHAGTQAANLILEDSFLAAWLSAMGLDCSSGAIEDMQVDDDAIMELNGYFTNVAHRVITGVEVPKHALATFSTPSANLSAYTWEMTMAILGSWTYEYNDLDSFMNALFDGEAHDLFVGVDSQLGGLLYPAATLMRNDDFHSRTLENTNVVASVIELLRDNRFFTLSSFNPPLLTYDPSQFVQGTAGSGSVAITSPTNGTIVQPGAVVAVQATAGGDVTRLVFTAGSRCMNDYSESTNVASATFTYQVPSNACGPVNFTVRGFDTNGFITNAAVSIDVQPLAGLMALIADDNNLCMATGEYAAINVSGMYLDFSYRDLTFHPDTLYLSGNPAVAQVTASGLIKGVAEGATSLTIMHNGTPVLMPVTITVSNNWAGRASELGYSVAPSTDFVSSGVVGGPLAPDSAAYVLSNAGPEEVSYCVPDDRNWFTVTSTGGTIAAYQCVTVTVSFTTNALDLDAGTFVHPLRFGGETEDREVIERLVSLTVTDSDADGDGMPDGWETRYSLNTSSNDAGGDADSDGVDNITEYRLGLSPRDPDSDDDGMKDAHERLADTSPMDPDSVLKIYGLQHTGSTWAIRWSSEPGKSYIVSYTPDITVPATQSCATVNATPPFNTYTDVLERATPVFYRITLDTP